jgi:small-conductance mechanosensitive channel
MTLPNLFSTDVPLGRTLLLAWLTATFFHLHWGTTITFDNVTPVEFALQAGILYGCYILLIVIGRAILLAPLTIIGFVANLLLAYGDWRREMHWRSQITPSYVESRMEPEEERQNARIRKSPSAMKTISSAIATGFLGVLLILGRAARNTLRVFIYPHSDEEMKSPERRTGRFLGRVFVNAIDVGAMFLGFIYYSDSLARQIAPAGLVVALVLYVLGFFD